MVRRCTFSSAAAACRLLARVAISLTRCTNLHVQSYRMITQRCVGRVCAVSSCWCSGCDRGSGKLAEVNSACEQFRLGLADAGARDALSFVCAGAHHQTNQDSAPACTSSFILFSPHTHALGTCTPRKAAQPLRSSRAPAASNTPPRSLYLPKYGREWSTDGL